MIAAYIYFRQLKTALNAGNRTRTFDETSARPLNLGSDDDLGAVGACPHQAGPRLDRENRPARNVRCTGGCYGRDVVIEIAMHRLILELALRLLRSEATR